MKQLFVEYATYNTWANGLLLTGITSLTEQQTKAETSSSFTSLYATVLHMLDAESIWWQRMKLQEKIIRPSTDFTGSVKELAQLLLQQNKAWQLWIGNTTEHGFQHEFIYFNQKKERFKQPIYQMLLHLFNHQSYHRGQLVNQLRQLGVDKIPATDFIVWSRKK